MHVFILPSSPGRQRLAEGVKAHVSLRVCGLPVCSFWSIPATPVLTACLGKSRADKLWSHLVVAGTKL